MERIDPDKLNRDELLALARWYADMGVDCAISEDSVDRFAESARAASAQPASRSRPPLRRENGDAPAPPPPRVEFRPGAAPAPVPPDQAALSAREAAAAAKSLAELEAALNAFDGCALKRTASRLVFADGNSEAKIMFVGEAPGADEDRQGKPFVGRAGQLLDRMLAAIGLDRTSVYIANAVPWRPPGNRTPTPQETQICLPFIRRQIELCNPSVLVCLGGSAAQTLLGGKDGIMRMRGRWFEYAIDDDRTIPALAMLHPAFLLRSPIRKRDAWKDMLALKKKFETLA
ncbi:MAG: uracil-DNA glycosylase [Beijerinckiaceae bacterium]